MIIILYKKLNNYIWLIDRTLTITTTAGKSGNWSNVNEMIFYVISKTPGLYVPYPWYEYVWNVHRMFITYIHRTYESRNTKNTYDFLVQVRCFLLPLSLKVLRQKERDTHSFYSGFSICPRPTRAHPSQGLREKAKVNRLLPRQDSNQLTSFKMRFGARDLPLNPIVWRKADCVYCCRTTFSPSAINTYFMEDSSGDKYILYGLSPGYGYFSGGSSEIQKDFLAPDLYLNCFFFGSFFYSIKEYCY